MKTLKRIDVELDRTRVLLGTLLTQQVRSMNSHNIQDYEFKVFSQSGEDGIIQKLISCLEIRHKTFIEFGVEDFTESNCRFLMVKSLWRGFVMDGSAANIRSLRSAQDHWAYDLTAKHAFITRENVNDLLRDSGFDEDLGLLSIDVDGVDYWLLEAIRDFKPRLLIVEFNAVFGSERPISVPYKADFFRTREHFSNLYFGASLPALTYLANKKGYALVGTNSAASNAFFVREDLLHQTPFTSLTAAQAYTNSVARESRDEIGRLTFVAGPKRYDLVRGLEVINVITGKSEKL